MKTTRKISKKTMTALLLLIALAVLGWQLGGTSLYSELRTLRTEHNTLHEEVTELRDFRNRAYRAESEYETLLSEMKRLEEKVPPLDALPGVLESLEEAVALPGGAMESFTVLEAACEDGFCSVEVNLAATCRPVKLAGLLRRLESFPHLLAPLQVRWVNGENGQATLEMSFLLIFTGPRDGPNLAVDRSAADPAAGGEGGG